MPQVNELQIHTWQINAVATVYRTLNNAMRQRILRVLHASGELTVTELHKKLRLEQSIASMHLAILRRAGVVYTERKKKFIIYRINYEAVRRIADATDKLLHHL